MTVKHDKINPALSRRRLLQLGTAATSLVLMKPFVARAQENGPGVTTTEIKLGQTGPYSGSASAYGVQAKSSVAYFNWVNDNGGINGRKVNLISLDDGYSPPKTVEQTRKLVEQENVLAMFGSVGTPTNTAVQKYLNQRKVPQLFIGSGASQFFDPEHMPMTIPWQPNYALEGSVWAAHILANFPNAKIALLYPNDDFGRANINGFKEKLATQSAATIVAEQTYESSDPSVDPQIITLATSQADVFINMGTPKFASQAIRKAAELGWTPTQYVHSGSNSIDVVLKPAGLEKCKGLLSLAFMKDPAGEAFKSDPFHDEYLAWHAKYLPDSNISDTAVTFGYIRAQTMHQVLERCGDDLTRENLMAKATSITDLQLPLILDGILFNVTPTDYSGVRSFQTIEFDGDHWVPKGDVVKV
ncbi:MAG: ABC transporter substrate-binding protein [Mesorhizobium sp.]